MTTVASEASAQLLYDWINPSGGSYQSAVNWFPGAGAPPGPNDGAEFGLAATYTVNFFSDAAVSEVDVFDGNVTFDLNPGGTERTYEVLAVEVAGFGSTPRLTARDGTMTSDMMVVSNGGQFDAATPGASYSRNLTVTGAGSTWTSATGLAVPALSSWTSATLNITSGGNVSDNGAGTIGLNQGNGTATVNGAGSKWTNAGELTVGYSAGTTGTLTIEAGSIVSNTSGIIGRDAANSSFAAAHGAVTVTGANSKWTNSGSVVVGSDGTGMLSIEAGGQVSSNFGFIADFENSTGTATVTGSGSSWNSGPFFSVAQFGHGTVNIENGGNVYDNIGFIGSQPGSTGAAVVTGPGSTWSTTGNFVVGFEGTASLSVSDGGTVSSNNTWMAGATTSTAVATISGASSNWTISGRLAIGDAFDPVELGPGGGAGSLFISPGGAVNAAQEVSLFPDGHIHLQGGTLDAQTISFQGGGEFDWTSGTLHVGTFDGNLVNGGGTLAPGHSPGVTGITGSYTQQAGAMMEIEIGGPGQGTQFDFINVTGTAFLDGDLKLKLIDSFTPTSTQTFVVLDASSLLGAFDNIINGQRLAILDGGASFIVHYGASSTLDPTQIVLSDFLGVALPGDYNQNGIVDAADYVVWRKNSGTSNPLPNDPFGGTIGSAQYNNWRAHFGQTAGSGAAASVNFAIPEPATVLLTIIAGTLAMCMRRRAMLS